MASFPRRAASRLRIIVVIALLVMTVPLISQAAPVRAQNALYPGAVGLVADSGAEPVLLRETPSFDAAVLTTVPAGVTADVVEGPVTGDDGTSWYGVSYGGLTGYIVAGYLVDSGQTAAPAAPAPEAAPVELAQEAAPVAMTQETAPVATTAPEAAPAGTMTTADVYLRAEPSFGAMAMMVIPAGAAVTPTGEWSGPFAGVTYQGQHGWVEGNWLGEATAKELALAQEAAPAAEATVTDSALVGDLAAAPAGGTAYAADVVNLRAGPSEGDAVLRVLPTGGPVTVTGETAGGWTPVWYNGTAGYISADLLSFQTPSISLAQEAAPAAAPATTGEAGGLAATTLSDVNLRGGPEITAPVLGAIPAGVTMPALAGPEQGYYQVSYGGQTGWVSGEYLQVSTDELQRADQSKRQEGKVEGSEPARNAELGAGGIIWPVTGGLWEIMQGYHGSSHRNESGLWQYEYSLDLARVDGDTAGQEIISPVNGVVTWTDPSTGGISIDIGNDHAVALFHVTFMDGLQAGTAVRQGQYLGQISGPGGPGYAGVAHVHVTLWSTSDHGNWDRHAEPFTGPYAISGMDLPDSGGYSSYEGTQFSP